MALRKSGWTPGSHNLSRFLHYSRRYWFTPKNGDSDQIYRIYKKVTPHGFFKKHRYTPLRIKNTMVWFLITSTLLRYCSMILLPMYYFFYKILYIYIYIFECDYVTVTSNNNKINNLKSHGCCRTSHLFL